MDVIVAGVGLENDLEWAETVARAKKVSVIGSSHFEEIG
jgi:hypothetical protein